MTVKHKKNFIAIRLMLMISCIYIIATVLGTPKFIVMAEDSKHSAHIEDNAGLLSDSEESNLLQKLTDYAVKSELDLVILTTDDLNTKVKDDDTAIMNYVKGFLEDYIDENLDNGTFTEDVAILYFDSTYRWLNIQGYGSAENILNDDRIETILDKISSYFGENDYYNAFLNFGKNAKYYATLQSTNSGNSSNSSQNGSNNTSPNGSHGNNYNSGHGQTSQNNYNDTQRQFVENVLYKTWFQLLAAIIIGVITVAIMASRSGGRVTINNHTYLNEGNSGIVARRDDYISTSVTKVKRPEPNHTTNTSSSGGGRSSGGGGVSSGGRSHSGGGRRV
ncbi:TPM domain-containing protein [Lachnoclostridium sp.]|uniref:TPM domain-containing protein n=1 Tax=Lachnoclostridium sp. TaxID=2028282 RepID=UPI0028A1F8DF|nr:TPM domain-containing protein [Lachnoclostridium sp.]